MATAWAIYSYFTMARNLSGVLQSKLLIISIKFKSKERHLDAYLTFYTEYICLNVTKDFKEAKCGQ